VTKLSELFCAMLSMAVVHSGVHEHFVKLSVGLCLGLVFCVFV